MIKQYGASLTVMMLCLVSLATLLLTIIHQQLNRQLQLNQQASVYLTHYNAAMSSLNWAVTQRWPLPTSLWFCQQQPDNYAAACLKKTHLHDVALLCNQPQAGQFILYRLVNIEQLPKEQQVVLHIRPSGWLDFMPDAFPIDLITR